MACVKFYTFSQVREGWEKVQNFTQTGQDGLCQILHFFSGQGRLRKSTEFHTDRSGWLMSNSTLFLRSGSTNVKLHPLEFFFFLPHVMKGLCETLHFSTLVRKGLRHTPYFFLFFQIRKGLCKNSSFFPFFLRLEGAYVKLHISQSQKLR